MAAILVVEDDPGFQKRFETALLALGHAVLTALDKKSALAALQAHPEIELVILDQQLAHGSLGEQIALHIREKIWPQRGKDRPAFISASSMTVRFEGALGDYYKRDLLAELEEDKGRFWFNDCVIGFLPEAQGI